MTSLESSIGTVLGSAWTVTDVRLSDRGVFGQTAGYLGPFAPCLER